MKALVFGATGGTGRLIVERCLAEGHETSAFIHRDRRGVAAGFGSSVRVSRGDVRDRDAVRSAVDGHEAVLVALGVTPGRTGSVLSSGTRNIVREMEGCGVSRLIVETGAGLAESVRLPLLWRISAALPPMRSMFADKRRQEEVVRNSGLVWTIVRPANLTDGPQTNDYSAAEALELDASSTISRADVASFMVSQMTNTAFIRKSVMLKTSVEAGA